MDIDGIVSAPSKELVGQLYVDRVMSPLLGFEFVDAGIRIPVSRDFLEFVENKVTCKRSSWRIDAGKIDTDVILSFYYLIILFFLLVKEMQLNEPYLVIGCIKPSSCMKERYQHIKYDPVDLFSGSKDRIYKAVRDLFSSPQNNFRVFLDGDLIFGTLGSSADGTDFMIQEAFEDAIKSVIQGDNGSKA